MDLTITANNHVFDWGYEGLVRTIRVLDEKGMSHTGTWEKGTDRQKAYYTDINETKVAVIAYTYSTNWKRGKTLAEGELEGTVNLLRPQTEKAYLPGIVPKKNWIKKLLNFQGTKHAETVGRICELFGYPGNYARKDDLLNKELAAPYIAKMHADIRAAKEKADIVIFAPHIGGQFRNDPGEFSKFVIKNALEAGADATGSDFESGERRHE